MDSHTFTVDESERQAIILSLAELSIARPGWLMCLETIALKMDNKTADGKAQMFEQFRLNHSNAMAEKLGQP
jgi:hypothetical protein